MNNDLISREALKKAIDEVHQKDLKANPLWGSIGLNTLNRLIDNAPAVETYSEEDMCDTTSNGFDIGYDFAKAKYERPQGECKNCKHFKESLCENSPYGWCSIRRATQKGDLETQVPKDYYCSWYEKGGES